jgi:hypothetical protein
VNRKISGPLREPGSDLEGPCCTAPTGREDVDFPWGLLLHCGRGGLGGFGALDEEERDGDGGQANEPADPECPVESAGERVRDGVALAEQDTGARGRYGYPDRAAELLG